MKKIIAALAAFLMSTASIAGVALSGKYTGTLDDSGVYTQDLVTTLVGASAAGSVTVTLDKDFAVDDMFVESTIAGIDFKLGEVDDVTSIGATTTVGPVTVGVNQVSGGSVTFDVDGTFAGVTVGVDDITSAARETSASYEVAGLTIGAEHAKSGDDHQVQLDVSTVLGQSVDAAGVASGGITITLDHNQNADRDEFEDGSWGGSVSTAIGALGTVKAEGHLTDADVKTYELSVTQGIFTAAWEKVGSADGSLSLKAVVEF